MTTKDNASRIFFCTSPGYFWQWADDGAVIEMSPGRTLAFREELAAILESIHPFGMPPLDAMLLVLAACRNYTHAEKHRLFDELGEILGNTESNDYMKAGWLLDSIQRLPEEYRTGQNRIELLKHLSENNSSCQDVENIHAHLAFLRKGNESPVATYVTIDAAAARLWESIVFLGNAADKFPNAQALLQKLNTADTPLVPLPLDIPFPPVMEYPDVLTELEANEQTAGLAKLARMLKAVMRFPASPDDGATDQFGGVSDIGNRGDLHRLLLSELAQDDDMLLARLANNETLFYRKENLPSPPETRKIVAIDVTMRMWGSNRLFAIAAALAWTQHEEPEAWIMTGKEHLSADLLTGSGVLEAMTRLSGSMHCGDALAAADKALQGAECLFVSSEENFLSHPFQQAWNRMKHPPAMMALIDKDGRINVYRHIRKHRKLLTSAVYDLNEVLEVERKPVPNHQLPAIFSNGKWPLYFPWIQRMGDGDADFVTKDGHVIRITKDGRVMLSTEKSAAAQLHPDFPKGTYYCGYEDVHKRLSILAITIAQECFRYVFNLQSAQLIDFERVGAKTPVKVEHWNGRYYFSGTETFSISCFGEVDRIEEGRKLGSVKQRDVWADRHKIRVNYSVYANPNEIYVSQTTRLCVGSSQLEFDARNNVLRFEVILQPGMERKFSTNKQGKKIFFNDNKSCYLRKYVWPNGAIAWSDSRGLIHLRSADGKLPDMTIVALSGRPVAVWTSDNRVAGSEMFIDRNSGAIVITLAEFWAKYWQPFIHSIQ